MPTQMQIICPHCGSRNRLPADRPALQGRCGSCHQPLFEGRPLAVDPAGFERHLAFDTIPLLVDVWAPWCGPCRMMAPMFEKAAAILEPEFRLLKLNADTAPEVMSRYGIRGIPTLLLLDHGRLVDKQAGATDDAFIVQWARSRLAAAQASMP